MYKRCQICVNCGRCPAGTSPALKTVTERILKQPQKPIAAKNGERLVTVDIGTTTVAMQLYGADGACVDTFAEVNPQVRYGADVLSRITAAGDPAKAAHMKMLIRGVLQKGIDRFLSLMNEGESPVITLAANTVMTYLLMGWNPEELGRAPFAVRHLQAFCTRLTSYDLPCYVFPPLSAFVGGDIVAGIQAVGLAKREEWTLLVDLGTNGELALGNRERIAACATAAGPAFEGGANRGVWGADMVRLTAYLKERGILDETGFLREEYQEKGIRIGDVGITQPAVRALQCAKAAIAAGIRILSEKLEVSYEEIDRVILAGGFGYFLDPASAAQIGLLPQALAKKAVAGGNTALEGALCIGRKLLEELPDAEKLGQTMGGDVPKITEIVNLAQEERFQPYYLDAMSLQPV